MPYRQARPAHTVVTDGPLPGCFSFYRDFGGLVVFCVLFGLCGGTCQNLLLVVIIDLLGLDNLGKALGLVMMVNSICLSIAHPLLGQSLSVCLSVCLRGLDNLGMVVNSICLSLAHSLLSLCLSVCLSICLSTGSGQPLQDQLRWGWS